MCTTVHHNLRGTDCYAQTAPSTNRQSGQMAWIRNRECVATNFELINATSLIILGKLKPESAPIQIRSIKSANFYFLSQNL